METLKIENNGEILTIEYGDELVEKVKEYLKTEAITKGDIAMFVKESFRNAIDKSTSSGTDSQIAE